jgi:hypothetical protein
MFRKRALLGLYLTASTAFAQPGGRVDLGRLQNGAVVSFIRDAEGEWGIEISGGGLPRPTQPKPAEIRA